MFSTTSWSGVRNTYLTLTLLQTLAASFIWGINTLFLLDAGLSNAEAFGANAAFTAGMMIFEIPTGVVADTRGRRLSFLLGAGTLFASTLLYLYMWQIEAGFLAWAVVSALLGLGFTFFSGATEAWLVDALSATGFEGDLESVFAKGQIVSGIAMLTGSVAGGYIAQVTNLGVPYVLRAGVLALTVIVAAVLMRDIGFRPDRSKTYREEVSAIVSASLEHGWRNPPVRWLMLAAPFTGGVGIYVFYAAQPYLLELYGDPEAFGIAGLAAAIVAGAQILGGLAVPVIRKLFRRRTTILVLGTVVSAGLVALLGIASNLVTAVVILVVWAVLFSALFPVRQAYINGVIPSRQRATVLSFDSLMSSTGGVVFQPVLGRSADAWGYGASYLVAAVLEAAAIPFVVGARRSNAPSDPIETSPPQEIEPGRPAG